LQSLGESSRACTVPEMSPPQTCPGFTLKAKQMLWNPAARARSLKRVAILRIAEGYNPAFDLNMKEHSKTLHDLHTTSLAYFVSSLASGREPPAYTPRDDLFKPFARALLAMTVWATIGRVGERGAPPSPTAMPGEPHDEGDSEDSTPPTIPESIPVIKNRTCRAFSVNKLSEIAGRELSQRFGIVKIVRPRLSQRLNRRKSQGLRLLCDFNRSALQIIRIVLPILMRRFRSLSSSRREILSLTVATKIVPAFIPPPFSSLKRTTGERL
jgi:hypothetical protein